MQGAGVSEESGPDRQMKEITEAALSIQPTGYTLEGDAGEDAAALPAQAHAA